MKQILTQGSAYRRGLQQGQQCKSFFPQAPKTDRIAGDRNDTALNREIQRVNTVYPQTIEELKGIAEGLGMGWDYFYIAFAHLIETPRCSTVSFFSENCAPLIAKTDDVAADERGRNIMEVTHPDHGYKHIHFHFSGTVWSTAGMNEHGFCFAMNGIPGPTATDGTDSLTALHQILPRCKMVDQAISLCTEQKISHYGYSIMVSDASDCVMIEKNSAGIAITTPQASQVLLHTNVILDETLACSSPQQPEPLRTNAINRMKHMEHFFQVRPKSIATLRAFVKDQHPDGPIWQTGQDGLHTDYAVVMNPRQGTIELLCGQDKEHTSEVIDVFQTLNCPRPT